jgi:hypothetical protein
LKAIFTVDGKVEKIPKNSQIDVYISNEFETQDSSGFVLNIAQQRRICTKKLHREGYEIIAWVYNVSGDCHVTLWVSDTNESYYVVSEKKELLFNAKKSRK